MGKKQNCIILDDVFVKSAVVLSPIIESDNDWW